MYGGTSWYYDTIRPQYQLNIIGENYIEEAMGGSHEIKGGFEYRLTPVTSLSGYGMDAMLVFWDGVPEEVWECSKADERYRGVRTSFYLQDIFNRGKFTWNIGVRYDRQWGNNVASAGPANPRIPNLIPQLDYPGDDSQFTWNDIVPRLGMTYDISGDGSTIIRANFSMYAEQLGAWVPTYTNPMGWREIDFAWNDLNGDRLPSANELGTIYWWNFDYTGTNPLDNGTSFSSDLASPRTYEFLIGVEREVRPELAVSANYIYRRFSNFWWAVDDNRVNDPYTLAGTISQSGYSREYYEPTMAPAYTTTVQQRPDTRRTYSGFEVAATKRLSNKWMANASFYYGDTIVNYDSAAAYTDPTNVPMTDGASYAPQTSGSGKSAIFINSRWAFKLSAMYQLPLDINMSGYFSMREGFVHPIRMRTGNRVFGGGRAYPLVEPLGSNHLPTVTMLDLRVEKVFRIPDIGRISLIIDAFNVFNSNSELGRNRDAYSATFDRTTEIINPRILRIGVRFQF